MNDTRRIEAKLDALIDALGFDVKATVKDHPNKAIHDKLMEDSMRGLFPMVINPIKPITEYRLTKRRNYDEARSYEDAVRELERIHRKEAT